MMNSKFFRKMIVVAVLFGFAISITSCSRGYGCPTNFSMDVDTVNIIE